MSNDRSVQSIKDAVLVAPYIFTQFSTLPNIHYCDQFQFDSSKVHTRVMYVLLSQA